MSNNISKKNFIFKHIVLTCFAIMLAFSVFNMGRVLAGVERINISNAIISDKSSNTEAAITSYNDNKVVTDIKYHAVDEFVEFTITLRNNDSKKYTIKTITDNNTDRYIEYTYDKHENEALEVGSKKDIVIKATYKTEVTNITERQANDDVEIKITFIEEDGSETDKIIPINPTTGDNLWIYVTLGILSLSGLLFTLKFKKINKTLIVLLLMTPVIAKAASLTYEFKFVSEIGYYDKLVVTVDRNGTEETKVIPYGTTVTEPATITIPGYNFVGFYIDGNPADFSKPISKDTLVEARYSIITYNITYDLAGGTPTGDNPTTYTVEDEFVVNNPKLTGYNFSGWTGTNLPGLTPTLAIHKGTTEDLSFTANFSPATNTKYTVKHEYQHLTGTGYDIDEEHGTGTTGTTIYPQTRPKTGYLEPAAQALEILPNGSAVLEYVYDRVPCTFEADSNTNSSLANGTYRYGTTVTVSPKVIQGYTFSSWNDGNTDNPRTITLTGNTSVSPSYTPHTNTPYTVTHRYQKITLDGYDVVEVPGYGTTGTTITAPLQPREGFETPSSTTLTVYGDGSGAATYTYNRTMLNFNVIDRTYLTSESTANGSYPYGAQISVAAIARPGYDFEWSDGETSNIRTFEITSSVSLTPVYTARNDTGYTVNHYKQKLDGSYEPVETEHLTGTTDQNVTPVAKTYTGFTLVSPDTKPIAGTGDTEFDYYYSRDKHVLTVLNPENVVEGDLSGQYYYEQQIELTAKTIEGYTFDGWTTGETTQAITVTMGTSDITVKPQYSIITYTVTFDEQGGEGVADMVVAWNTTFAAAGGLPSTSKTGSSFDGWFTDDTFTTKVTNSTVVTGNMSLVAKFIPNDAVAELNNNQFYTTIQNAVHDAPASGQSTIKVLKDVTVTSGMVVNMYTTDVDKDIILDLNNHTIKATTNYTVRSKGNLIIKNGTIQCTTGKGAVESNTGTLILDNVRVEASGNRQALYIENKPEESGSVTSTLGPPEVEIRGNSYLESKAQDPRGTVQLVSGTLRITNGTIVSTTASALYVTGGTATVGTQDGAYDNTTPVLKGNKYGINGTAAIYDGIMMGKTSAVYDENQISGYEAGYDKATGNDGTYYILYYQMP